jgi:hypothetical protein
MIAMYMHAYRNGWIVCGAYAPYRRIRRYRAAVLFVVKAYRLAVGWAIRDGEAVPGHVLQTYVAQSEEWIMAAKESDQLTKGRAKLRALRAKAVAASKAGTPTWVDRAAMKVTTTNPRKLDRVPTRKAVRSAQRRAARQADATQTPKRKAAPKRKAPAKKAEKVKAPTFPDPS